MNENQDDSAVLLRTVQEVVDSRCKAEKMWQVQEPVLELGAQVSQEQFSAFIMRYEWGRRFLSKVFYTAGCWLWSAYSKTGGHGVFSIKHDLILAHRVAFIAVFGHPASGLQLDHVLARGCGNPSCVNPNHLEPVEPGENYRRGFGVSGVNSRKTHCNRGHVFDERNTRRCKLGGRNCRECDRLDQIARRRSPANERIKTMNLARRMAKAALLIGPRYEDGRFYRRAVRRDAGKLRQAVLPW